MRVRGWLVALAMLAIGALLSTAVGSYRRSTATAYRGELKWNDRLCDFAVTWGGQYRGARPTPCRGDAMYYLEHWMPIILPDGRRLQPPKWKPGMVKETRPRSSWAAKCSGWESNPQGKSPSGF